MIRCSDLSSAIVRGLLAGGAFALCIGAARADSVADFYRSKTVTIVVGYSAGGGYDIYARAIARHMSKHIPGDPKVVVQDMPGAGSLVAANYLYNLAPKDGTVFGTFARGIPMEPLIGTSPVRYDAAKFAWLGSASYETSVCAFSQKSGVKTWDDFFHKEATVGGEGSGSDPDIYASLLHNLFGAKLKLVTGYPGGADMTLAIERNEIDGRCGWSWDSLVSTRPQWASGPKKLNIVLQMTLDRSSQLPDVPTVLEEAKTERERQIVKLIVSRQLVARPFAAPPGLPEARKAALVKAFADTLADPDFVADAKAMKLEVSPVSAARVNDLIAELYRTPPAIIAEAKAAISGPQTSAKR